LREARKRRGLSLGDLTSLSVGALLRAPAPREPAATSNPA
jgi:hypothetical protein